MRLLGVGQAPGKVILFGEHAVVYGRPALAVPVTEVRAEAVVTPGPQGAGLIIRAEDLGREFRLHEMSVQPLAVLAQLTLERLGLPEPDWLVVVRSSVPIASGMGSGAAVSTAVARGLAQAAGRELSPSAISALVFEVEKLLHGTPSGVDNTVIAFGQPVYFVTGRPPLPFAIGQPFLLVIADSGIASPTWATVGDVRRAWEQDPSCYEAVFDRIAGIVESARTAMAGGEPGRLGALMDENHAVLRDMALSCPALEELVCVAHAAGAQGAKLSGSGRGGNLIALVTEQSAPTVAKALLQAGAVRVITTWVGK